MYQCLIYSSVKQTRATLNLSFRQQTLKKNYLAVYITAISCTASFVLDYDPLAQCSKLMDIPSRNALAFLNCFDKIFGQMGVMFCLGDIMRNSTLAELLGAAH